MTDQLRERFPQTVRLMDDVAEDVLAHVGFPEERGNKNCSTNPLERLNGEIKRRTDEVSMFPNDVAIYRPVGALLLEQKDEWVLQRRNMTRKTLTGVGDNRNISVSAVTASPSLPPFRSP